MYYLKRKPDEVNYKTFTFTPHLVQLGTNELHIDVKILKKGKLIL